MLHRPTRRFAAAILGALLLIPALGGPAFAATGSYVANCDTRLRTSTSTGSTIVDTIASGTLVTASGSVSGSSWSAGDCGGKSVSGSSWLKITAVNGKSTSSLYGRSTVYAATGLFSAVTPPSTSFLEGVDVSSWQGAIDYSKVFASGRRFVIAKATEGIGFTDGRWATNRANVPGSGLRLGAYHYARPDLNSTTEGAKDEADWFVSEMDLVPGMLIPALDLEVHGSLSVASLTSWVQTWLGEVYAKTGSRAMIYVSPSFWRTYLGDSVWFAKNGYKVLWVAHWTTNASPSVPASNWGGNSWTFWQYTDNGTVPGIGGGGVDLDRFNGTDLTKVTYGADFDVAVGNGAAEQAAKVSTSVSIARDWFSLPVGVSVSGLPSTVSASVAPSSTTGSSASLTLTTGATPVGSYPFTVTGSSNGLVRKASATLVVTDGTPPKVVAPSPHLTLGAMGATVPVRTTWSASDPSGIGSYRVERRENGGAWSMLTLGSSTTTGTSEHLAVNGAYQFGVRATDRVGNASAWAYGPTFKGVLTQQPSTSIHYSTGWTGVVVSSASGRSLRYATRAGAWASYTFSGRAIGWVAYRGPTRGKADVYIDGVLKTTVNLYASTSHARPIVFAANWSASGTHTIKIVVKGTAGHPRVDLDAFVRLVAA